MIFFKLNECVQKKKKRKKTKKKQQKKKTEKVDMCILYVYVCITSHEERIFMHCIDVQILMACIHIKSEFGLNVYCCSLCYCGNRVRENPKSGRKCGSHRSYYHTAAG